MNFLYKLSSQHLFVLILFTVGMISVVVTSFSDSDKYRIENIKLEKEILQRDTLIINLSKKIAQNIIDLKTK